MTVSNQEKPPAMQGRDSDVICVCFNVTRGGIREFMSRPGADVESLFRETNIGTKCTACMLDLDVILSDIHAGGRISPPPGIGSGKMVANGAAMGAVERVDSAFFICENGVITVLRLANFNPLFGDGSESVAHDYRIWLMAEDGNITARIKGRIEPSEQIDVDFSDVDGCPPRGWFLISLLPLGPGYYGTLRPQALLIGEDWASSYHVQFHYFATNTTGRRTSVAVKSTAGRTWSSISVINGENRDGRVTFRLSGANGFEAKHDSHLAVRGSMIIDLDSVFDDLPDDSLLICSVESDLLTRKYLINKQPDGKWGADHFPSVP